MKHRPYLYFLSNTTAITMQGHCSVSIFYNFATLAQNICGLNYSQMVFRTAKTAKVSSRKDLSAYGMSNIWKCLEDSSHLYARETPFNFIFIPFLCINALCSQQIYSSHHAVECHGRWWLLKFVVHIIIQWGSYQTQTSIHMYWEMHKCRQWCWKPTYLASVQRCWTAQTQCRTSPPLHPLL